jgi:DNA repair protein RecO
MARLVKSIEGVWFIINGLIVGYVIGLTPYKEVDAMVKVFSKDGYHTFYVRKAMQVHSDVVAAVTLGAYSQFHLKSTKRKVLSLNTITQVNHVMSSFTKPDHYFVFEAILELINKTIEEEDGKEMYQYFEKTLQGLTIKPYLALYQLLQHVIHLNGIDLVHHQCVICHQKKAIIGVSYQDGGVVCQTCGVKHQVIPLPRDALLAIVYPHKDEFIQALTIEQLKQTIEVYRLHLVHQLQVKLVSLENLNHFQQ